MTIGEIVKNIDKSAKNSDWIDINKLGCEFGLNIYVYREDLRLKSYFFVKWLCTDTWVGGRAYFLDDELVATTFQPGRKFDEIYYWASKDAFKKTREYLLLIAYENDDQEIQLIEMDAEWGNGRPSTFSEELLTDTVILKNENERVEVIEKWSRSVNWEDRSKIKIKRADGIEEIVDMKDGNILIPYNLI
jgi:hypothetical protein